MITLRPYQSDLLQATRDAMRRHRSVLMHLPTGGGKTALAATMLGNARAKGLRGWFIAHRDFLLTQTAATFDKVGIPFGFIAAGRPRHDLEAIQICAVATLGRRLARLTPPHLIIWDEAHHCAARTYDTIYNWAPNARHVGLTATPCRLDGKGLRKYFGEIVPGPTTGELIEQGWLAPYKAFAPSSPDLRGVHTRAGDYARDELATLMNSSEIVGDMVGHYQRLANGMRAVYYAVSIKHSEHIAAMFNAAGIPARHLDAESPTDERIAAAKAFAAGDLRVLTNVDLFGEGYDLSAQAGADVSVEAVGLARPTQSLALHLQQMGRSLRLAPGKEHAIILDHAGNLERHGFPDDDREWTLEGAPKKPAGKGVAARMCKSCFAMLRLSQKVCPHCGAVAEAQAREVDEIDGELEEVKPRPRVIDLDRARAGSYEALLRIERERGYKPGWARHVWDAKQRREQFRAEQQARAYGVI